MFNQKEDWKVKGDVRLCIRKKLTKPFNTLLKD